MSILSKKLYVQKTGGTAVACNIYSTSAEAGDKALRVKIDNTDGYIALKATDDANATGMRVKIGTVIYAVATKHESGGVAWRKGAGGEPNGHASTGNNVTDGFALSFDKSSGDYGKGGNFGGSGGYDSQYVAVTAGQSYTITVGAAGGSNGSAGFVLIAYGGDI